MALPLTSTSITGILILTLKLATLIFSSFKHPRQTRNLKMFTNYINNQTYNHTYNHTHNHNHNHTHNHTNISHEQVSNFAHNHTCIHTYKHRHTHRHNSTNSLPFSPTGEQALQIDHSIARRKRRGFKKSINSRLHSGEATYNSREISKRKTSCVLEGHLTSNQNWFGYLANVTVRMSASMRFEMTYPADRCCQNVLFYLAEEAVMVQPHMDCHQREVLLSPRDERMLRLSEQTPWAGCQKNRNREGKDMLLCKGSRSFSHNLSSGNTLTTWYVAVSDCLSTRGLNLFYRLNIVGNVGDCHEISNNRNNKHLKVDHYRNNNHRNNPSFRKNNNSNKYSNKHATMNNMQANNLHNPPSENNHERKHENANSNNNHYKNLYNLNNDVNFIPPYSSNDLVQRASLTPRQASDKRPTAEGTSYCEYIGNVNSSHNWYGFMRNVSMEKGGVLKYHFSQPASMQVQNVILYRKEDVVKLDWEMSCWEKEGLIPALMVPYQILDMSYRSEWSGCRMVESGRHKNITCSGLKRFEAAQKVHLSLSNCRSNNGVLLHYRLHVYGHKGACSSSPQPTSTLSATVLVVIFVVMCLSCRTKLLFPS